MSYALTVDLCIKYPMGHLPLLRFVLSVISTRDYDDIFLFPAFLGY